MPRTAALRRADVEHVAPEVDDDLTREDVADLLRAVDRGRESARTEPLLDDAAVFAMARDRAMRT
jgi:hypothetical protein